MRILYDGTIYKLQVAGGVNRYFANIIQRLPNNYYPIIDTTQNHQINYPNHPNLKINYYHRFGLRPGRLSYGIEPYYFRWLTAKSKPQLLHPTYYTLLTQQNFKSYKCPIILTVYDTIHEIFSEKIDPNGQQVADKRKAVLASDLIMCISENTQQDLLKFYPEVADKVKVTYLASEIGINLAYGLEEIPKSPYFLYVGGRWFYKNFERLLLAFAKIRTRVSEVKLCVVGAPFTQEEKALIGELKLEDYLELYEYASDRHLAKLYRCSIAFVYPSLYEGFGIPPLEAMACQTPVIAANTSSIPEVVGDAALLFDPYATDELADLLLLLLDSPLERDRLIQKGQERSQLFSWDKTANQTIEIYQSLI